MAAPLWSSGNGNMNDSTRSTAAAHNRQAFPADSPSHPISDAGSAAYPNPLQHRVRRMARSIRLPTQQDLATVLSRTLQEHYDNRLAQSSNTDALAYILAAQLHIAFGPESSPRQLVPAPPANHNGRSDVDSDVSWASGDESGIQWGYFKQLHREIVRISKEPGEHVLTEPLKLGARKLVHFLARQNNCSHTTFGEDRVFVSADAIDPSYKPRNRRRSSSWSCRTPTVGYYVVPNAVSIRNLPPDATGHDVINKCRALGISSAKLLRLGDDGSTKIAEVEFHDAEDVADCFQLLHGQELRQHDGLPLRILFHRRPVLPQQPHVATDAINTLGNFSANDSIAAMMECSLDSTICSESMSRELGLDAGGYAHVYGNPPPVATVAEMLASFNVPASNPDPTFQTPRTPFPSISRRSPTFNQQTAAGPSTYDTRHLVVPSRARKRPNSDPSSDDASHSGSLSGTDSGSGLSRRKRNPRIEDFYKCGKGDCDKSFDIQGDCTKHRRIHLPNDQRPYPCRDCELAFIDARDLRRHLHRRHQVDPAVAKQLAEVAQPRRPPPPDFDQPDPFALTVQIPDERLSTVATSSSYTQDMHTPSGGGSQNQSPSPFADAETFPDVFPLFES